MTQNKWLDGEPDIRNGLMVCGDYDNVCDDTKHYDVYTYPDLKYVGRFNASRFSDPQLRPQGEQYPEFGKVKETRFTIWRTLFPNVDGSKQWLERINWGNAGNGVLPFSYGHSYSIVNTNPVPFQDIIERIKKEKKAEMPPWLTMI